MELQFGFLADAVQPGEGSKLCALGIGIDRVIARTFPAHHASLGIVARIRFEPGEDIGNPEVVLSFGPLAGSKRVLISQALPPAASLHEKGLGGIRFHTISLSTYGLELPTPGAYAFEITVGDVTVGSIPLWVQLSDK